MARFHFWSIFDKIQKKTVFGAMTENNSHLDTPKQLEKESEKVKDREKKDWPETGSDHLTPLQMVRSIAELLEKSSLTEIEYRSGDFRVRAVKAPESVGRVSHLMEKSLDLQTVFVPTEQSPSRSTSVTPLAEQQQILSHHVVKSPMVGTAYLSPKPGDPPFISVDSVVQEGQTVLIIEAMKTMNTIKAQKSGRVRAILVNNGDPVEFGQALVHID
ncbi:MAG: acetyl-CoA carboxylase biotin carboxyl carrier protein [Alphaproteobacteria bacterium]|nr:acetyl-CoA carboxylase biotin carboxyl carrier protein [Alphaproteobacteria bacterium]